MPLNRYQLRNEYNLADPELYKVADKDDPEALLEGVAMAGLVGVLRQLGDLAEFAAEIFHDLHEEVMATAARGHGLIVRVQQLEAEFPSIERTLLSQTSHTAFLYNTGVDWHPNLSADQSVVTRGDLPRFVMDSYEECRGPPRLFLLDKYDVAGAGACLKRLTDPSFFKMESTSSTGRKLEGQREKKARRVKKRGPRWRNGDTPESFPSSHAKLHQLFLEERIESGINDPARRVKLKKRQFTGSLFEQDNVRSYMEKFLDTSLPEQKILHEICVDSLQLTWTSDKACEAGLEIVDIGTISPVKESRQTDRSLCSSPDAREMVVDPSMDLNQDKLNLENDHVSVEVPGLNDENNDGNMSTIPKEVNIDDACEFEDVASEIDNYVDALANIESEVETDSECKKNPRYLNWKPIVADSDGSERHRELQSVSLDSQSVGNSATSEDGDNFSKGRESSSCSNSVNTFTETTPDIDAAVVAVPTIQVSNSDFDSMCFDHHSTSEEILRKEREKHAAAITVYTEVDDLLKSEHEFGEALKSSSFADINKKILPVDMGASLSEFPSDPVLENSAKHDVASGETDRGDSIQAAIISSHKTFSDASEDSGHCFGAEPSIHDKECQNTSLCPDMPRGVSNISEGSACSLVEGYDEDSGRADIDSCSDSGPTSQHQPVSEPRYLEKTSSIYLACEEDFFIPSTEENSKDLYSASDSFVSFGIQELLPGTANPGHAPSLSFEAGDLSWSREDPSVENSIAISEERVPSASHAGQAGKRAISSQLQNCAQEISSSEFTEAVELNECGFLEADVAVVASSKDESLSEISEYAAKKIVDDSFKVGKSSPTVDPLETQPEWLKLLSEATGTTLLEVCQDEASKQYSENDACTGYPVSVGGNEGEAALHVGLSTREPVSQDFTCMYPDQTKVFGPDTALADPPVSEAATIYGEAKIDHVPACQDGDEDRILYCDASLHDMPFKRGYDPDYVLVAKNDPDLDHDVEKVEHAEVAADGHGKDEVEDYHNDQKTTLPSTLSLHPEELHEPPLSDTQQFWQTDEELTKGYRGELTESRQLDRVQDVSVTSPANMCNIYPDGSPPLISLDVSLPEDVKNSGKLAAESLLASEESSEHLELSSSHQTSPLEANHLDLLGHNLLKPDHDEKEKSSGAAALHYDDQPILLESSPQSAEHTLETSSLVFHGNGMLSGVSQVTQVENSGQPLCQSGFPDLGKSTAEPQINLEPPSLPPLPPMQWRLGKFRNASAASAERQMVQHSPVPVHVPSMSLSTMYHNLAPVQPVNLSAVHHALASFQPVTLAAANGTITPIPLTTQPAILPAVHYAYAPLQPVTLPTRDNGIETISRTLSSEGQLGYSDGYLPQQGVFTLPMPVAVSEGFYQINMSAVGRQENLPSAVPSTSKNLDGYEPQQGIFLTPVPAVVSEGTSQSDTIGVGRQDSQPFLVTSSPTRSLNGIHTSEESNQPNVDCPESGSMVEDFSDRRSFTEAKVNAETGIQNELLEHDPQFSEEAVSQSDTIGVGRQDSQPFLVTSSPTRSLNGIHTSEESNQPNVDCPESGSMVEDFSEHRSFTEAKVNAETGIQNELLEHDPQFSEEAVNSSSGLAADQALPASVAPETEKTYSYAYDPTPVHADGIVNGTLQKKPPRPRNPLIDEVVAIDKSKLRKVDRTKPSSESQREEGESRLEQLQLRKVERVRPSVESKVEGGEYRLEHSQLRKVGERVKSPVEQKAGEEFSLEQLQLRKVGERVKPLVEPKSEEREFLPEQLQLRKIGLKTKQEIELKVEETGSPLAHLRKVRERVKDEVELKSEETESPRVQLRKVGERAQPQVGQKVEERDSLFEQIRNKSFNLKPAVAARPNIQGPRTNLKVAAILEKASTIRQAMAGSDEDDDADNWSDS